MLNGFIRLSTDTWAGSWGQDKKSSSSIENGKRFGGLNDC
jgi:hypothetical protein